MATSERTLPSAGAAGPVIRAVLEDDLPRILEIERACFSTPWREATFRSLLRRTDTDLLAAEVRGALAGYAACWTVLDQAEIGNVAVEPRCRGRGVGGALVDEALRRVAVRGAAECYLEVRTGNTHAQALYRSRGFAVVGRRPRYYADPTEDALVMRVRLEPSS
jgi:[ribosomal protein S18]-alanine N-acetyltransferase